MRIFSRCFWLGHRIIYENTSSWTDYGYEYDADYYCDRCDWFDQFAKSPDTIPDWFVIKYYKIKHFITRKLKCQNQQ